MTRHTCSVEGCKGDGDEIIQTETLFTSEDEVCDDDATKARAAVRPTRRESPLLVAI